MNIIIIVAGRLGETITNDARDGIFVLSVHGGNIKYVAPYPGGSFNADVRSLNISDQGDVAIYEDRGTIMILTASATQFSPAEHHPGHFPTLMPNGKDYIYENQGSLMLSDRKITRTLFSVPKVVGAIRISPDGHLVAFGVERSTEVTQLKICILSSHICTTGPEYTDWIAGRETFWMRP
jgi:hypothetical protein